MKILCEPVLDEAAVIAESDVSQLLGQDRCGCVGAVPGVTGYPDGTWLADAIWVFMDSLIYGMDRQRAADYLFSEQEGALGVLRFFAELQEKTGRHRGNIPVAKYLQGAHNYTIDCGGMFDLSVSPRRNFRDEVPAGSFFVHGLYYYWRMFGDIAPVKRYYPCLSAYLAYRRKGIDGRTGLFASTYGLGDVAIDQAVERSCALVRVNAWLARMFLQSAALAEAVGESGDAEEYRRVSLSVRNAINTRLWNDESGVFETLMFRSPTRDRRSPAYGLKRDSHFFVEGNMALLYFDLVDGTERRDRLIARIEEASAVSPLHGLSVTPPYPDGWHNAIFNSHQYWNGDVWPAFGSWYAIALFRLGYPALGQEVLLQQARVAVRDGGFSEYYEADAECAPKGCMHYGFTAAPFHRALVEGLFGLDLDAPGGVMSIGPSVTKHARIEVQLGGHAVVVEVEPEERSGETRLVVETTYRGRAALRVLLDGAPTACRVRNDEGNPVDVSVQRTGTASYAVFSDRLDRDRKAYAIEAN
jgi:hypothetical protein